MNLAPLLHPELGGLPPDRIRAALREARRTPLDILELIGIAAALIAGTVFVRGGLENLGESTTPLEASTPESIAAGATTAVILIALFLYRRTRRGLRRIASRDWLA